MFVRHRQRFTERGRLPFAGHRKEAVPAPQADQGRSPLRKVTLAHDFPIERLHIADDLIALRQAYDASTDYGIREVIRTWILDAERVLEEGAEKSA